MKRFSLWMFVAGFAICLLGPSSAAADWPMWRCDAARSAVSPEEIAAEPVLLWSRKLPRVRQAWPQEAEQRLNFDASYEPVVLGKSLILGSPNDGSVTAYDTETGRERWKFYTEGPVRCAPACWRGKIYAGSDDGCLYCLDAGTGEALWKFRGAPPDRPLRRQLGNEHLASFWPVRGGPVVANGVVYFGAGIWPVFGVFVHALDAETGKPRWTNANLGNVGPVRIDHDEFAEVGMSPQGCFAVAGDRLLVPNSRGLPAALELAAGKLTYYMQGCRHGDCRVAVHGDYVFVGKDGVLNLGDLRELGSRWVGRGDHKPDGYRGPVLRAEDLAAVPRTFPHWGYNIDWDLYECPGFQYKLVEGCDASSAFDGGVAYGSAKGVFYAYNLAASRLSQTEIKLFDRTVHPLKWRPETLWQFKTPYAGQAAGPVIKAGTRLYGSAGRRLIALENLHGKPRLAWEKELAAAPTSLVAADGKLLIATAEGEVCCFGAAGSRASRPPAAAETAAHHVAPPPALDAKDDEAAEKVRQIISATGVKAGYCLALGLTDGRLIHEFVKQSELCILAADADAAKIERLRRHFDAAGLLGSRVELFVGAPSSIGFPPYLASLIVSDDHQTAGFSSGPIGAKLLQSLRPYGGTLCLQMPPESQPALRQWARAAGLANAVVKRQGRWSLLVREGPLPGAACWTHEAADVACSFTSQDDLVKAPLGILWYGDGNGFVHYHDYGAGVKPLVSGGRVYAATGGLLAVYDAYTGRPLWRKELKAFHNHARFAALEDGVYVAADGKCTIYDPAAGNMLRRFTFNTAGATTAKDLRVGDDVIVVACARVTEKDVMDYKYLNNGFFDSQELVCLDRKTGVKLWQRTAKRRFHNLGLALGRGLLYCIDSPPSTEVRPLPRGAPPAEIASTVWALDLRTGAETWMRRISYPPEALRWAGEFAQYSAETGILLVGRKPHPIGLGALASGLDAATGKIIWEKKKIGQAPVIFHGKEFISGDIADHGGDAAIHSMFTGEKTGSLPFRVDGCNYIIGSRRLIMARSATIGYTDIERKRSYNLRNIRSGCSNSLPAADGLLNSPNFSVGCICNYPLQTSLAMIYMPEVAEWDSGEPIICPPPSTAKTWLPK